MEITAINRLTSNSGVYMKSNVSRIILVVTLAAFSLIGWNVYGQDKKSSQVVWEYQVISFLGDNPSGLSQLGEKGWELTSVRTEEEVTGNFRHTRVYYYLKRGRQMSK